jgi:divinyl protochlorophyllide a 8-vinyl-reductase
MMSVGLTFDSALHAKSEVGLVGPNAVIQLAAALRSEPGGEELAERVFQAAGFSRLLRKPPDAMIDEAIPARLFDALWRELPPEQAAHTAHEAGRRTGAYILANRIPKLAQLVLRLLPQRVAAAMLLRAIHKNAWTFAGSGLCSVSAGDPAQLMILFNPLKMPGCVWHCGVLEQLFRSLVGKDTRVRHRYELVNGSPASCFDINWRAAASSDGDA